MNKHLMKRHLSMYHTQIWYLDNSHLQHVFVFSIKTAFIHGIFCIQHNFKNTCIGIFGILYQLLKIIYNSTLKKNLSYLELWLVEKGYDIIFKYLDSRVVRTKPLSGLFYIFNQIETWQSVNCCTYIALYYLNYLWSIWILPQDILQLSANRWLL